MRKEPKIYSVKLPLSKSIAARRLILDFVLQRDCDVESLPNCDDTSELNAALRKLREHPAGQGLRFDLGTGGTSLRFFVALVASLPNFSGVVDCAPALKNRPLQPLIDALRSAGADIEFEEEAKPPLLINGKKLSSAQVSVDTSVSSQYASAIAMASMLWDKPWRPVNFEGIPSAPYMAMTLKMIDAAEAGDPLRSEADWSAASYFYEYALLTPGIKIKLPGLLSNETSLQGDSRCESIFRRLGVKTLWNENSDPIIWSDGPVRDKVILNMAETPDLVPALTAAMCGANIPFRIEGIANLRVKESNRIETLCIELARFGYKLAADNDSILFSGMFNNLSTPELIDSHGDHRMAMCLAALAKALVNKGLIHKMPIIKGEDSVAKSFPDFFMELKRLDGRDPEAASSNVIE